MNHRMDYKSFIWSSFPKKNEGTYVCLRTTEWNTGVLRVLTPGAVVFLIDNPFSFELLRKEMEYELYQKCVGLGYI